MNVVAGFVSFETSGEFAGVGEEFLGGRGMVVTLGCFGRAGMADTMIGPSLVST